ncbi:hypothetical protein QBC45DRAFT_399018 [Copromyces sp. CBS 386.78]|nr:hypothetical protein QBC45DRAFT_399018 [Copromyces sp. CBS 386.78]
MRDEQSDTPIRQSRTSPGLLVVQVIALITHGVFSGDAIQRINASALDRVVVTNTVRCKDRAGNLE